MRKKRWASVAFIFIALSIVAWMYMYTSHDSEVVLINTSTERIRNAEIGICDQQFKLQDIKPGESRKIRFNAKSDSHYKVVVEFGSKRKIMKELGYVTPGLDFRDTLKVENSDIEISRRTSL